MNYFRMSFDSQGSEKPVEKLVNRKRASNEGNSSSIDWDQMKSETTKRKRFDFSHDPKVLEVQKRILNSMKNTPSVNEPEMKYSCSINSDGNVESQKCYSIGKKNDVCSGSRFDINFKSASGRPLVKKVLPVFMSNVSLAASSLFFYFFRIFLQFIF
ncbi:hypothetical protein X798_06972 [Onchocerca flexuosa]|uniref:Uncharacterized protein n=1 Tax=Onchocerca flexuosa TaxID=387005 RepID=A0A238BLF8_9BILA|nr:hypothetical protein X798_06972 [Onchocerca flexuosa]